MYETTQWDVGWKTSDVAPNTGRFLSSGSSTGSLLLAPLMINPIQLHAVHINRKSVYMMRFNQNPARYHSIGVFLLTIRHTIQHPFYYGNHKNKVTYDTELLIHEERQYTFQKIHGT